MAKKDDDHFKRQQPTGLSGAAVCAPTTTAGAHALRQYEIYCKVNNAKVLAKKLHALPSLYPADRDTLIRLQALLNDIKRLNSYEPNMTLDLFPP